jgi:hypothetical protein
MKITPRLWNPRRRQPFLGLALRRVSRHTVRLAAPHNFGPGSLGGHSVRRSIDTQAVLPRAAQKMLAGVTSELLQMARRDQLGGPRRMP